MWGFSVYKRRQSEFSWVLAYLDVFHVLKEVRLRVIVVGELYQISELFLGGKSLHQAGQDAGVVVLHTLVELRGRI